VSAVRFAVPALLVYASPALAASSAAAGTETDVGSAARVFASLAVVIALIFAASWLLKRLQRGNIGGGNLHCIESIAVGLKERVVLVQAGDRQLLLGVAPGSVCTLHIFDEPLVLAEAHSRSPALAFRNVLSQFRGAAK
jgi:flagellar protein FliO/FliZ